jgi:hypothetical protein
MAFAIPLPRLSIDEDDLMTDHQSDTQPVFRRVNLQVEDEGLAAPPRFLLFGCIFLFVLVVVGGFAGLYVFRDVLRPSQQQRILEQVPFMRAFMKPTPDGGTLPTVDPALANSDAANALLSMPLAVATVTADTLILPIDPSVDVGATATTLSELFSSWMTATALTSVPFTPTPELATPTPVPATATTVPLATATVAIEATVSPTVAAQNSAQTVASTLPNAERIIGFRHNSQTWNNCGPATMTMAMSYFGWTRDQEFAKDLLRPNREDKNVSPSELVRFVNEQSQLRAIARVGGDLNVLKSLIAYKFPVIIERGAMFEAYDWVGHYQLLVAYDDIQRNFYAFDSFMGTGAAELGVVESYQSLDEDWRAFNRTYIVVYNPADEGILQSLLGERWDAQQSAELAFEAAQGEARANRQDGFAWFNMGSSLTALGRYSEAARAFDQARQRELPWRMLWYQFGMYEAYYQTQRYDDVLSLAQSTLTTSAELEESYYWMGRVYEAQGDTAQAASEYQRALSYNSTFQAAREALDSLG